MLFPACRNQTSISPEAHVTTDFPTYSVTNVYATQPTCHIASPTVRETLLYTACLRLSPPTTPQRCRQLVGEIILELDLNESGDMRVGDGLKKDRCSGGERRRVSIDVRMFRNPSILFFDEPITGLSATDTFHLVNVLRKWDRPSSPSTDLDLLPIR